MNEQDDDPYEGTAQWLVEVGRRRSPESGRSQRPSETSDEVLQFLEERTGRSLRSKEAIAQYVTESEERVRAHAQSEHRRRLVRESVLLAALTIAILQYYYWDVLLQIDKLDRVTVFLPIKDLGQEKARS